MASPSVVMGLRPFPTIRRSEAPDWFPEARVPCGIATHEPGPAAEKLDAAVAAAKVGDTHALEIVLRAHYDRIHAVCRRITANDDDALDATQEALIAISRGIGRFDGRSALSTWVYRVAANAALDEVRRRRRRPEPLGDDLERTAGWDGATVAGTSPTGSAVHADPAPAVAARVDVDRALRRLLPGQRAAIVLRDLIGLEYAEIAEVLEIPIGTVRSRIARGRVVLAAALREECRPATGGGEGNSQGVGERRIRESESRR